jgi:Flp pilus assembly protein TadG
MLNFRQCSSGSVAIFAGLASTLLVVLVGVALDYSRASGLRTRLLAAADYAVLAALNPRQTSQNRGEEAQRLFLATLAHHDKEHVGQVSAVASPDEKTLELTFRANSVNTLMGVAGIETLEVAGTSAATISRSGRQRIHFLLDTSESMGVPSSEADRNFMVSATGAHACFFACHNPDLNEDVTQLSIARSNNVVLRLDSAKKGIEEFLHLAAERGASSTAEFSLSAFSREFHQVIPTGSPAAVRSALADVELGGYDGALHANTLFSSFAAAKVYLDSITQPGVEDVVVLATDGVKSKRFPEGAKDLGLIESQECDALKSSNRRLAIIHLQYVPVPGNTDYEEFVRPLLPQLEARLQACASDRLYARGIDHDDIIHAFRGIFEAIEASAPLRLTR